MIANRCNVSVYTTHEQTEQPAIVHYVTAISMSAGLLTVECEVTERGYSHTAYHRFEPGQWSHFEVHSFYTA